MEGKLIEIPYTKGISSDALTKFHNLSLVTPDSRRGMLRRLLEIKKSHDLLRLTVLFQL